MALSTPGPSAGSANSSQYGLWHRPEAVNSSFTILVRNPLTTFVNDSFVIETRGYVGALWPNDRAKVEAGAIGTDSTAGLGADDRAGTADMLIERIGRRWRTR
jgi:hypothetical protein